MSDVALIGGVHASTLEPAGLPGCHGPAMAARDVLVIHDGTPSARNAVWRAAFLAHQWGVGLSVLHAASDSGPPPAASQARLEALCADLAQRLGVSVRPTAAGRDLLSDMRTASAEAGLLVVGSVRPNPLRDRLGGTQAERIIRLCRLPTLVVRRPAVLRPATAGLAAPLLHYCRAVVAVDLTAEASDVLAAAACIAPLARIEAVHAQGTRSRRGARDTEGAPTTTMQRAQLRLQQIVEAAALPAGASSSVRFGDATACLLARQRALGADLIIIGKRQRGLLADFLLGGVTRGVLSGSEADVLVVPKKPG